MKQPHLILERLKEYLEMTWQSYKNRIGTASLGLLMVFTLLSCGTANTGASIEEATAKEVIASHKAAMPQFNTLAGRVQFVYETEDRSQSITVSLRMEKDKIIWVKASILGITIAKV